MSQDEGDDINFNELVGNLLSTHNANNQEEEIDENTVNGQQRAFLNENVQQEEGQNTGEIADFNVEGDEDALAAVVANAIQNMDQERISSEALFGEENSGNTSKEQLEGNQHEEWAQILQHDLLQANNTESVAEEATGQTTEQLDQDDENLRRAILESLQELNVADEETQNDTKSTKPNKSSKKSSKKKKKDKLKTTDSEKQKSSSSKKKKHSKEHKKNKHEKNVDNLLTSEDVIKGFMQHEAGSSEAQIDQETEVGDAETHALVEATLKAFERELLGPTTADPSSPQHKTSSKKKSGRTPSAPSSRKKSSTKKKVEDFPKVTNSSKVVTSPMDRQTATPIQEPSKKEKKKKKKKAAKTSAQLKETSEEDEFSRALADMVNQVVNTSLADSTNQSLETTTKPQKESITPVVSQKKDQKEGQEQYNDNTDDTFDLNQIMQKAMAMAFQEQQQEGLSSSVMEDFNRGLGDFGVPDILTTGTTSSQKKKADKILTKKSVPKKQRASKASKSSSKEITSTEPSVIAEKVQTAVPKPGKALPSPIEIYKKKYSQAAKAAASTARKLITEKNKATKAQLRAERKIAREEKMLRKRQEEEKLTRERKELEDIVAKGPPYPPDLRLTKRGKPKRPYRRWTKEELEKRINMSFEDPNRPRKVKKAKKRKSKKLKRIPLSTLRKIPLFNFVRSSIPSEARQKLNGIDDSLKKIPLQSYKLDINKLAPPEKVTKEELDRYNSIKSDDASLTSKRTALATSFDITRKTVIRREKIPFHPPWAIPSQPPFSLPVARRRRKEKSGKAKNDKKGIDNRKHSRDVSVVFNARNKIIPAILFPIINTLKAAAKAKAASGASTEEASHHLMTIIKHTKKSIAETLALSRKNSRQDYSSIKTESDIHRLQDKDRKVKRIPIFSLANIRKIEAKERASSEDLLERDAKTPTVIKIEDEVTPEDGRTDMLEDGPQYVAVEIPGSGNAASSSEAPVEKSDSNSNSDNSQFLSKQAETASETIKENQESSPYHSSSYTSAENGRKELPSTNLVEADRSRTASRASNLNTELAQNSKLSQVAHVPGLDPQLLKTELGDRHPILIKKEMNGDGEVRNVIENLMKRQFSQTQSSSVDLPSNFESIISATIGELIPTIEKENLEKGTEENNSRKRSRKAPPQVLNLDGLVPPVPRQFVAKAEEKDISDSQNSAAPKLRQSKKKMVQPTMSYTFNIPDIKEIQGKRIMLLKRAKEHLTNDEMNILKKEVNKERKRKWREANVEKNWENDLRARLKRRATMKFGEVDSVEKNKWFEVELAKNLAGRDTKKTEENGTKKVGVSTNLSDNEILNMIASTLGKLEVARKIEGEINDAVNNSANNKTNDEIMDRSSSIYPEIHHMKDNQFSGEHTPKERYPDDIPIIVPLSKRPAPLSSDGHK